MASVADIVLAESEISLLVIKERYYRDTAQWELMREAYHPDASKTWVDIQWYTGDIDGWITATMPRVKRLNSIHTLTPATIHVRGNKALSESWCTTSSTFQHQGIDYDKFSRMRLISKLERVDSPRGPSWKMLTLECIYIRDSITPTLPQRTDTVPTFEGMEKFPKSYRCSAWLLTTLGLTPRTDTPNEGNPESVAEVLKRNRDWVNVA